MPSRQESSTTAVLFLLLVSFLLGSWHSPAPHRRRTSGALKALRAWSSARAWPDTVIPDDSYFRGALEAASLGEEPTTEGSPPRDGTRPASTAAVPNRWRSLGPTNIGGRTLCVTINPRNPNTIYAGSAAGGLWVSRSGGVGADAWDRVTTGFPVLAASCLAIAPNDTNVMYLGTGEVYTWQSADIGLINRGARGSYGIGILKSTDAGGHWSSSLDWSRSQKRGVWQVRVDPEEPNRVWAATTEGVYKSIDSGATWSRVLDVVMAMDLEINPFDPDTVFAACGNFGSTGLGIYRTVNGGTNWTKLAGGLPTLWQGKAAIAISPQFGNVIYAGIAAIGLPPGSGTVIMRSVDSGTTWVQASGSTDYASYQYWYSHDVAVQPNNYQNLWLSGIDFWRSTTSGANPVRLSDWQLAPLGVIPPGGPEGPAGYVHADIHQITFHPTVPTTIYLATDGGIFRTTTNGTSFAGCNGGYVTSQFYPGFAVTPNDTMPALGGMQDNYSAIFQGGPAWNRIIGGDGCWAAIDPGNPLNMYGSYQYLNILHSIDGGMTWGDVTPPGSGGLTSFAAPYLMSPSSSSVLFGGRTIVYKTVNGGTNWTAGGVINGRAILSMAVTPLNANRILVGTEPDAGGNALWLSDDQGTSWSNVSTGLPSRYPLDVAIAPDAAGTFYATFGGFGTAHVYRSTNAGASWQSIGAALPDLPTWAIAVDPLHPQHLFVGNDLGVFVTPDGGVTWGSFRDGLPEAVLVSDLVVTPGPRRLRLVTHGNGVFDRPIPDVVTGVGEPAPVIAALRAGPNPFARAVRLSRRSIGTEESIEIFDPTGRRVRVLDLDPGIESVMWDGRTDAGEETAGGVYFARMKSAPIGESVRLVRTGGRR